MIIYIKMDLALNNLQRLICHKTEPHHTKSNRTKLRLFSRHFMNCNWITKALNISFFFCVTKTREWKVLNCKTRLAHPECKSLPLILTQSSCLLSNLCHSSLSRKSFKLSWNSFSCRFRVKSVAHDFLYFKSLLWAVVVLVVY